MPMPEASMYENHLAASGENHVGLSGQITSVFAIAITHTMGDTTHRQFRH